MTEIKKRLSAEESLLNKLAVYEGEDMIVSSHELDLDFRQRSVPYYGVKSKFPTLDKLIDGFRGGELITISGPTKNGKTLLAQSLTVNFIKQQESPLWFSFEVPPRQFLSQFPELPLFYLPRKLKPHILPWLMSRIAEGWVKYHTRIIFIDHLHYLFDMARLRSPSLEIGTIIRKLKSLAVKHEFIIFLLCHTTKGKQDILTYEAIRDSSFVSQESDSVLLIKRDLKRGENSAVLQVEFHRRTGVLEQKIYLEKVDGYLQEERQEGEPLKTPPVLGKDF